MKIKEFSNFYKKYFTNWFEMELMMMYTKLYTTIKESYELKYVINKFQMNYIYLC